MIYAKINQEPGVEMTLFKIIFASNVIAAGEPESEGQGSLSPLIVSLIQ